MNELVKFGITHSPKLGQKSWYESHIIVEFYENAYT